MLKGVFIIGTDTGVGKTVVTAALLRHFLMEGLAAGGMKPVETGVAPGAETVSDSARIRAAAHMPDTLDDVNPYRFPAPLAPLDAARLAGTTIQREEIIRRYRLLTARYRPVIVEGAGGLLVPVGPDWSMRDLVTALDLPVVIVGRTGLGGVNHALLTIESLRQARRTVLALVLNQTLPATSSNDVAQHESTVSLLKASAGLPILGPIPYRPALQQRWEETIETLAGSEPISELADHLRAEL